MTAVRTLAPFAMLTIWCAAKLLGFISRIKPNQQMMEKMREMTKNVQVAHYMITYYLPSSLFVVVRESALKSFFRTFS